MEATAAECWRVELRSRTPRAWKRTIGLSQSRVFDFCRDSNGQSDLIVIAVTGSSVVHLIEAGDEAQSERMLITARRALLSSTPEQFAREWGLPVSRPARGEPRAVLQHRQR